MDLGLATLASGGVTGGANILGGFIGGEYSEAASEESAYQNRRAQQEQFLYNQMLMREGNAFSAKEALKNREFQERLSSTAYQRAKSDLMSAGFNPLLALPNGASTPAGSAAHGASSSVGMPIAPVSRKGDILGSSISDAGVNAANTALQAIRTFNDAELNEARKGMIEASTRLAEIQERMSMNSEQVQQFDSYARREAMTGMRSREIDVMLRTYGENGRTEFNDLVKMYREQIRVGKYMPALNAIETTVNIGKDAATAYQGLKGK